MASRGDPADRSLDVVCDLLSDQRRQYALAGLIDHSGAISLTDLAEDVAGRENEGTLTEIPEATVRTISTSLHHVHIPKLVDAGAGEYDQDGDLVRLSESTELIERVLSLDTDGGGER